MMQPPSSGSEETPRVENQIKRAVVPFHYGYATPIVYLYM
jgi:hypothetical protein